MDLPASLSWPLVLLPLALPAPYSPAHTSCGTAPTIFDQGTIDVRAIGQEPSYVHALSRSIRLLPVNQM